MYERFDRRTFFWPVLPALILAACEGEGEPIIYQREQAKKKENNGPLEPGDLAIDDRNTPYFIRSNSGFRIPNLDLFLYNTKFKGRILRPTGNLLIDTFDRYPKHDRVDSPNVFDPYSGQERRGMPFGAEGILYYTGASTTGQAPQDGVTMENDGFVDIRRVLKERLKFELFNSNFFPYLKKADITTIEENIFRSINYLGALKSQKPYEMLTGIGDSLGAHLLLEGARRHPDFFNNLILIDMPDLYHDEEEEDVQKFAEEFTERGKGLVVIKSEGDSITKDSRDIKAARLVVIRGSTHGAALKSKAVHNIIAETIGPNRTAA